MIRYSLLMITLLCVAACGDSAPDTETQAAKPADSFGPVTAKPQGPVRIDYRIIGTPIVGQPLAI